MLLLWKETHMHTPSCTAFDTCFVLCFQQAFKLVWMCYIGAYPSKYMWKLYREKSLWTCAASCAGLSLTSPPPRSLPSLLHKLIQAWSDTCGYEVSVAIKMPPLHCFNWNLCYWCVNSCRRRADISSLPFTDHLRIDGNRYCVGNPPKLLFVWFHLLLFDICVLICDGKMTKVRAQLRGVGSWWSKWLAKVYL